jgi:hypothetical protein
VSFLYAARLSIQPRVHYIGGLQSDGYWMIHRWGQHHQPGVVGAAIPGCEMSDLLAERSPEILIHPSEDISEWLGPLQERIWQQVQGEDENPLAEISAL